MYDKDRPIIDGLCVHNVMTLQATAYEKGGTSWLLLEPRNDIGSGSPIAFFMPFEIAFYYAKAINDVNKRDIK
jgi:hypothetical protein